MFGVWDVGIVVGDGYFDDFVELLDVDVYFWVVVVGVDDGVIE